MARGFLSGALWGGLLGVGAAGVISVVAPPPVSPEVSTAAPADVAEPALARPASPETPDPDTGVETAAEASRTQAPDPDSLAALDDATQTSGSAPRPGAASGLADPAVAPDTSSVAVEGEEPVLPNPQALAPMEPQDPDSVRVDTLPAAPPPAAEPRVTDAQTAPPAAPPAAPSESDEPQVAAVAPTTPPARRDAGRPQAPAGLDVAPAAPADPPSPPAAETATAQAEPPAKTGTAEQAPAPDTGSAEEETATPPAPPSQEIAAAQPGDETPGNAPLVPNVQLPDITAPAPPRPQIGTPANTLTERTDGVVVNRLVTATEEASTAPEAEATAPADPGDTRPIVAHAENADNPDGKPLMSIVLIDDGDGPVSGASAIAALRSFPNAVTFAVDADLPDAAQRMQLYRDEGFEVLALLDMPEGARATDVETTFAAVLAQMDQVVGVLEGPEAGLQGSREVADQVTAYLASTGHGLVTQDRGLNTMPKLARKEGVPAAPIFRDFDSKGQTAIVIRRFLDQAAFRAGQEGAVIMLGRLRPDTISALLLWGLQDRASSVALTPVSAILTGDAADG